MGTICLQNVSKQFGGQVVLRDASVELHSGQTVGIVGPNGAGKTTLMRIILGRIPADSGVVTRSRGMDVGYLAQDPEVDPARTLHDEVLSAFDDLLALEQRLHGLSHDIAHHHAGPQYDALLEQYARLEAQFVAAGGYTIETRLREIVGGLGFRDADYPLPVAALSGGQKCRVALAKLLLRDHSFLLLDEPTNHLDIDSVRWLEKFLAGHHGGAAIISHDRYLLDRLCDRILEIDRATLTAYSGNYTTYARTRDAQRRAQERQFAKDQAFLARERDYIARNIASKRTDVAKGRRTRLERRLAAGEFVMQRPAQSRTIAIEFDAAAVAGRTILDVQNASKRYGDRVLFENLSLTLGAGERLGITGPNGTGKSTLLRVMLGQIAPDVGRVETDPRAVIGYYAQEIRRGAPDGSPAAAPSPALIGANRVASSDLDPARTVLAEVLSVRPGWLEQQARSLLGRFLFSGEDVFKPVTQLSGGEQSRVRLIKLMLQSPDVLVLDEPTNHLDIASREALEAALDDFPGAILVVSHDRYFLDRVVQRLLILRSGEHTRFAGTYSQWLEATEGRAVAPGASGDNAPTSTRAAAPPTPAGSAAEPCPAHPRASRPPTTAPRKNPQRMTRFEKMPLDELETFITAQERRLADLQERFGEPRLARDRAALAQLQAEFDAARAELAQAEETWLRRAEGG